MRLLVDMGHPAHVHFFKNAIRELEKRGHEVKITARDKDVTLQLLDAYGMEYEVRPSGWRPLNLLTATRFIKRKASDFKADKLVGVHNPYIARAAVSLKKPCILFTDTPGSNTVNRLSTDKATKVVTPECLAGMFKNQITYQGYKEMAYLHPRLFTPDESVLSKYGISKGEPFFIVRFIEWSAYHDSRMKGIQSNQKIELIKHFSQKGKVIASVEGSVLQPQGSITVTHPTDIHSLLALSSGYIGEGATMAKEAAVLGVPSVYISPFNNLPPIMKLHKEKRLLAIEKTNINETMKFLVNKHEAMEMFDLTSEIVLLVGDEK